MLQRIGESCGHNFEYSGQLIGGAVIDATGKPFPDATKASCHDSDAILLGAVGGPKWLDPNAKVRPEQGLLALLSLIHISELTRPY